MLVLHLIVEKYCACKTEGERLEEEACKTERADDKRLWSVEEHCDELDMGWDPLQMATGVSMVGG